MAITKVKPGAINMRLRPSGTTDEWKTLVCTTDTQFDIENEVTELRTNCGVESSPAEPTFSASGNAVHNAVPTTIEASYNDVKGWQIDRTLLDFMFISDADATAGLDEGEGVNNYGSGYFTSSSLTGSAESDGVASFSWTFSGSGTLDQFNDES